MTTKAQFIAQCKQENPTMIQTINDVAIELTGADYEKACSDWAEMKLAQQANDVAIAEAAAAKAALLDKLGITAEETTLLLG